jgi:hypothetical protein
MTYIYIQSTYNIFMKLYRSLQILVNFSVLWYNIILTHILIIFYFSFYYNISYVTVMFTLKP